MLETGSYNPNMENSPQISESKLTGTQKFDVLTGSTKKALEKTGVDTSEMDTQEIKSKLEEIKKGDLETLLNFYTTITGRKDKEKFKQWVKKKVSPEEFLRKQIDIYIEKTPEREAEMADKKQREELTRKSMEQNELSPEEEAEINALREKMRKIGSSNQVTERVRQIAEEESTKLDQPETPPEMQLAAWLGDELSKRDITKEQIFKSLKVNNIDEVAATLNNRNSLVEFINKNTPSEYTMARLRKKLDEKLPQDPGEVFNLVKKVLESKMNVLNPEYLSIQREEKRKTALKNLKKRLGL